ncbi:hypothetical protein ACWHA3_01870 [Streptomyces cyaneofuscatus]
MNQHPETSQQADTEIEKCWVVASSARGASTAVFAWTSAGVDDSIFETRDAAEREVAQRNRKPNLRQGTVRVYAYTAEIRPAGEVA